MRGLERFGVCKYFNLLTSHCYALFMTFNGAVAIHKFRLKGEVEKKPSLCDI